MNAKIKKVFKEYPGVDTLYVDKNGNVYFAQNKSSYEAVSRSEVEKQVNTNKNKQ